MFCTKCGKEIKDGQKFCTGCGAQIGDGAAPKVPPKVEPRKQVPTQSQAQPQQTVIPVQKSVNAANVPVTQNHQKEKKKSPVVPIVIAVVVVLAVIALGLVLLKMFVLDKKDGSSSLFGGLSSKTEDVDEKELFLDLLSDMKDEYGDSISTSGSKTYDMVNSDKQVKETIGVMGYIIQDVNGDDVKDMIVVYSTKDRSAIYANVYTIEDGEIEIVKKDLTLAANRYIDNTVALIYLKNVNDSWYLCGDFGQCVTHIGDAVVNEFIAYDCSKHSYDVVTKYDHQGSVVFEEAKNEYIQKAKEAGFKLSESKMGEPFAMQDPDIEGICGMVIEMDEDYPWCSDEGEPNEVYGTLKIYQFTDEDGNVDKRAAADFISSNKDVLFATSNYEEDYYDDYEDDDYYDYEDEDYYDDYEDDDFLFPDSDVRRLTDEDLEWIADDAYRLAIARNEMYARYGYEFTKNEDMIAYFNSKDWYYPTTTDQMSIYNSMSKIEKDNIDLIKEYENALKD